MSTTPQDLPRPLAGLGIKPLASLIAHPRLAIIVAMVVALLGVPVVLIKGQPQYQAHALIQVSPRYMKNLREDPELEFQSNTQYRQFVQHQVASVRRHDVLVEALTRFEPGSPTTVQQDGSFRLDMQLGDTLAAPVNWRLPDESLRRAAERLAEKLIVTPVPDTYLIRIALNGRDSAGLHEVVNSVVTSYLETSQRERIYRSDERVTQLRERETTLMTDLNERVERRSEIAGALGVTAFNAADGNPFDKIAQRQRESLADARAKRFEAEARLTAFETHGETDLVVRSIQETVAVDPGLNSLKASLNNRRAALLGKMAGLSSDHPGYLDARDELTGIEAELRTQTEKLERNARSGLQARYRTGAEQARLIETQLSGELDRQMAQSAHYAAMFNEAVRLSEEIEQIRGEVEEVRKRLNFFASEDSSPGFVRQVTEAQPAEIPFGPGKKKLALLILVAAFGAGLVAPILRDLLNRTVRAPNDVEKIFGFTPMGWIVEQTDDKTRRFARDQMLRLASALVRSSDRHGTRIIAFTSVKPGAGVTTVLASLARVLGTLGLPSIVVNTDAKVLNGSSAPTDSVRCADGFDMTGAPASAQNGVLDGLENLRQRLSTLGERYRFVLVDAPALLTASESEFIIRACDATITVVEAEAVSRGEALRAHRLLEKLAPESVGAIVNRVRPVAGGYVETLMQETLDGRRCNDNELARHLRLAIGGIVRELRALIRMPKFRRT